MNLLCEQANPQTQKYGIPKADREASPAEDVIPRDREHRAFRGWRAAIRRRGPSGPPPPHAAVGRLVANGWRLTLRNPAGLVWGVGFRSCSWRSSGACRPRPSRTPRWGAQLLRGLLARHDRSLPGSAGADRVAGPDHLLPRAGRPTSYGHARVPPSWLLGAQVVVNLVLLLVAVLVVVLGGARLAAHLPLQVPGFVLSLLLAAAAMFALGLWVASVASTQRAAGAIGAVLFSTP